MGLGAGGWSGTPAGGGAAEEERDLVVDIEKGGVERGG